MTRSIGSWILAKLRIVKKMHEHKKNLIPDEQTIDPVNHNHPVATISTSLTDKIQKIQFNAMHCTQTLNTDSVFVDFGNPFSDDLVTFGGADSFFDGFSIS